MNERRECILREHDFYVDQINQRVIAQFQDMEGEADRLTETEYKRLSGLYGHEDADPASIRDDAREHAIGHYQMLSDLKQQVILGALAGLYHQWEKQFRGFVERELMHYMTRDEVKKYAWPFNIGDVFDVVKHFGWDVRSQRFFKPIDACRVIVNVYKHGPGRSLDELAKEYPAYLPQMLTARFSALGLRHIDHEWLTVTETDFAELAKGLRGFWEKLPEKLYLDQKSP